MEIYIPAIEEEQQQKCIKRSITILYIIQYIIVCINSYMYHLILYIFTKLL